jgi:hypothetical protein
VSKRTKGGREGGRDEKLKTKNEKGADGESPGDKLRIKN